MRPIADIYSRALVTGGAGFVGSHLVDELLDAGLEVVSLDDMSAGVPENLTQARRNPNLREIIGDVTDRETVDAAMKGVDIVFHQAVSKNTVCIRDPRRDLAVNAGGTLNLLLAAVDEGVRKFVHASTGSVYGRTKVFPTPEDAPLVPVSYYGVSKLAGERYVHAFSVLHGLDVTVLRYFHVFGPRQDSSDVGGVVPIFIRRGLAGEVLPVHGDGTQVRAFTFVKDVTAINRLVAVLPEASGEVFNCASDTRVTIGELATTVLERLDRDPTGVEHQDWKPGDIKDFDVSNAKLKKLGFEFGYDFAEGLDATIASMKALSPS